MKWYISILFFLFVSLSFSQSQYALAQCTRHEDCDSGVCNNQVCEKPSELSSNEQSTQRIRPNYHWSNAYFEIAAVVGLHTWGKIDVLAKYDNQTSAEFVTTEKVEVSEGVSPGGRAAIVFALRKFFHLGLYYRVTVGSGKFVSDTVEQHSWIPNENKNLFLTTGLGFATKFGFNPAQNVFLGIGVDAGLHLLNVRSWEKNYANHRFRGIEINPVIVMDILAIDNWRAKIAIPIRLGVVFVPIANVSPYDFAIHIPNISSENGDYSNPQMLTFRLRQLSIVTSIGISFGG